MSILKRFVAKLFGAPQDGVVGHNRSGSDQPPVKDAVKADVPDNSDPRPASEYGGDNSKAYADRKRKREEDRKEDDRRRRNNDDAHNANLVTAAVIMSDSEPSKSPSSSYSSDSGSSSSFSSGGGGGD